MVIDQISSPEHSCNLCIVGTGPVGMALALEFERLGHEVLLLESGGLECRADLAEASRAEIVDPARHAAMEIAVCRALGGTSWTWGGRCVPYDAIDWMPREFVADANWPLGDDDLRPWYERASESLLCGSGSFAIPYKRNLTDGLTVEYVERWARETKVVLAHRERLLCSQRIRLSLNTTVTGLNLAPDGSRLDSLSVATPSGTRTVKAARVVLAMGGVETTRLLLSAQQTWPQHFGGADGALGRFYMGHLSGKIANIQFDNPEDIHDLDFTLDASGAYYRRRFMLTPQAQQQNQVLNTAFWPDNPPFYDPGHGSGVLSAVFLALAFPPTGRRLLSEPIRLAHTGPRPYRLMPHFKNAILGVPRGAADIYKILRDRFLKKPRKPGFLVHNRGGKYALHYHAEQIPNPESRIRLSSQTDAFGVPRALIDFRYTDQDVESVVTSHQLLDRALEANGIGRLQYAYAKQQLRERINAQAGDGLHQIGTTRMGMEAKTSVVDPNLRVHGIENLFVASSSVFLTSGQANSTYLAVVLALRLANYLSESMAGAGRAVSVMSLAESGAR
jgi:choline dehydrogenase-like flavoprotein